MPDNRSIFQKAKDEAKQIKEGVKSFVKGNSSRTRYGSSTLGQEIRDFKKGYNKEEEKQAKQRAAQMKMGGKMHDKRYGQGGIMQHD